MSDLVQAVKAAICDALAGDHRLNEDGSIVILVEPAARAAIRAVLEEAIERVAPPGNRPKVRGGSYHEGAFDGRVCAVAALRRMLPDLDG